MFIVLFLIICRVIKIFFLYCIVGIDNFCWNKIRNEPRLLCIDKCFLHSSSPSKILLPVPKSSWHCTQVLTSLCVPYNPNISSFPLRKIVVNVTPRKDQVFATGVHCCQTATHLVHPGD